MAKPIVSKTSFDAPKIKIGQGMKVRRGEFLFVGAVITATADAVSCDGCKFQLVGTDWKYIGVAPFTVLVTENWDRLVLEA
jgi:hypothetical protein